MAALWPQSLVPQIDANGDPLVGAQAFFWNTGTEIPQTTYADYNLSTVSAHDGDGAVLTDANGRWPAIFLADSPGVYRMRALDPDGVVLFDVDGVPVPQPTATDSPDAGDTSTQLLFQTGNLKLHYGTGALAGYVRGNGKTIGSAVSGATERANADAEDLFLFLWSADENLAVSTGRGANAAADWAADKTIALPDFRLRSLFGLGDMGNTASTLFADVDFDGSGDATTLGATFGEALHTLLTAEMPTHAHTATFTGTPLAPHKHTVPTGVVGGGTIAPGNQSLNTQDTSSVSAGTPAGSVSVANAGSDAPHNTLPPGMLITVYVKL